jgi:hypothetical protein
MITRIVLKCCIFIVYKKGLKCIEDFAVEIHFKNLEQQNMSIKKYICEKGKRVMKKVHIVLNLHFNPKSLLIFGCDNYIIHIISLNIS